MAFNVEALKNYEALKDKEGISTARTNIASLLFSVGKLKESMQYLDNAKAEMNKDNPLSQARFMVNMHASIPNWDYWISRMIILIKPYNMPEKLKMPDSRKWRYYIFFYGKDLIF